MALLLRGSTECAICHSVIEDTDDVLLFPHIIVNVRDPLFRLSDQACHSDCVSSDSEGRRMLAVFEESLLRSGPGHRECAVCQQQIIDPDDYFPFGHLTDDKASLLFKFNYTHLHRSHISKWYDAALFLAAARSYIDSGLWGGGTLQNIVDVVNAHNRDGVI
jgi:hypothetical protein